MRARIALMLLVAAAGGCRDHSVGLGQTDVAAMHDVANAEDAPAPDDVAPDDVANATDATDAADGATVDTHGCSCDGLECGLDPCGQPCGTCPAAAPFCYDNTCAITCRPDCDGRACGDDGCGGVCGVCPGAGVCADGVCACEPGCDGHECGDDGCGGSCGECPAAAPFCVGNACAVTCGPTCDGKACGDDGCGGVCGVCPDEATCADGACVGCPCLGAECGTNACGESCGDCPEAAPHCVGGACLVSLPTCPTATIAVAEGEEVIPLTTLHLSASSVPGATGAAIVGWEWSVLGPQGSLSRFAPSAEVEDPRFEVNVAGTYVFRLVVRDSDGETSCEPAEITVFAIPDQAIYVELTWDTPTDPDPTDTGPASRADLDLHFTHPFATGGFDGDGDGEADGWFDLVFDCFWFNPKPNWGSVDPSVDDDPSLERGDTDEPGPEVVILSAPEVGATYRVGVHYWNDHYVYGASFATVRVYIHSDLAFEAAGVELVERDMWWVATIAWPSGAVSATRVCAGTTTSCASDASCAGETCGLRLVPWYNHPSFFNPR